MPTLRRAYRPFKLQWIRRKYYLSVAAPEEISHFYQEGRVRRSTGISDKKLAELRAQELVEQIYHDFDHKFSLLDPFVEGLRSVLKREGVDIGRWYRDGKISVTVVGPRTRAARKLGVSGANIGGRKREIREVWEACNHFELARIVTDLGHPVPTELLTHVNPDTRHQIIEATEPKATNFSELFDIRDNFPVFFEGDIGREISENLGKPRQGIRLDEQNTPGTPLFSEWSKLYIENKKPNDSNDVHRKRVMACEKFVSVCGDKPLDQYDKIHAKELAEALHREDFAAKTIKNYYSYTRQAFEFAGMQRGEDGQVVLPSHPFHGVNLSEYGKKTDSYRAFTQDELKQIFQIPMNDEDYLILAILITTGMRLDEAALLTEEQIKDLDGILCFDLTTEGVRVKNKGSKRRIPIPKVITGYISGGKASNGSNKRLFSYRIHEGKAENAASKKLMKIIRKVTKERTKTVHSMRGNFKDFLREKDVPKEINDYITGHGQGDVASMYGDGPSLRKRQEIIDSIEHPWLKS